ncbi:Pentatricopeptide repeat-containing protein [Platanthera zijinensis]|uniref:Pentatricopeptide repeat-containing protein n=1 Tax=Platanthera zijinensis TaxID=2320716 RepID=A0AAP0G3L7_9ASPA
MKRREEVFLEEVLGRRTTKRRHRSLLVSPKQEQCRLAVSLLPEWEMSYAQNAFNIMEETDLVSWNSILSAYLRGGSSVSVLRFFSSMLRSGLSPDQFSFATALSACARLSAVREGRRYHCHSIKLGLSSDRYCEGSLVDMYVKCGQLLDARKVFDGIPEPDVIAWTNMIAGYDQGGMPRESLALFSRMCGSGITPDRVTTVAAMAACLNLRRLEDARMLFERIPSPNDVAWNAIISGHAQNGHEAESLLFFREMRRSGVRPTRSTTGSVLSAAANLRALDEGCQVHSEAVKLGLHSNVFVGSSLINMYAKCGCLEDASRLFYSSCEKNTVTWNAMLGGLLQQNLAEEALELFLEMKGLNVGPDEVTYVAIVGVCARTENVELGRQVHSLAVKTNMESGVFLGNALIDMYAKCGDLTDAKRQLEFVAVRDIVSWNSIIVGLSRRHHNGDEEETLDVFRRMRLDNVIPDQVTYSSIISACSDLRAFDEGKQVHCLSIKANLSSNPYVGGSLVDFYAKSRELENAVSIYSLLPEKTSPSSNALMSGFVQNGGEEEAVILNITSHGRMGLQLHCCLLKSGLLCIDDEFLKASLLVMYLRAKLLQDANKLLLEIKDNKSLVIWTLIISGFSQNGYSEEALLLFREARERDLGFDEAILASVLRACADLAALDYGRMAHGIVIRTAFESHRHTGIKLIDMYSKCGDMGSCRQLFELEKHKEDVILWNSMIVGLAKNGHALEALVIFDRMRGSRMNPDDVTFLGVLAACSHAGLVDEGRKFFKSMSAEYGVTPRPQHYACMIDVLGRGGRLKEAEELIDEMPFKRDGLIWATMLAAARMHGDSERGERAAEKLMELDPNNSSPYMLLSSIYAASGDWDGAKRLRHDMRARGVKKLPGWSWIEVRKETSLFVAGDELHPNANEIYEALADLTVSMKDDDAIFGLAF